jgi:hypothetical protein
MSYVQEREAIEKYIGKGLGSSVNIGWDGHRFEPNNGAMRLSITHGNVQQGTIGSTQNRVDYYGLLRLGFYTQGGKGSVHWRGYADTTTALFFGTVIDINGLLITSPSAAFIRFAPQDQYAYNAGTITDAPFDITTINVPFVRYETL